MEKLGTDPILIAVQIVNFGLLLFLLKVFLYKPILKKIEERRQKLMTIDKERELLDKKILDFEEKRATIINTAKKERDQIIEEAKHLAEIERGKIIEKANLSTRDLLTKVSLQIESERERAQKEIDTKVLNLSLAIARKITKRLMIGKIQQRSVGYAIKELRKMKLANEN